MASYLDKIGVKVELEPMDYTPALGRMMKKNHSEGLFFVTTTATPIQGLGKLHDRPDLESAYDVRSVYRQGLDRMRCENPKLTEKQGLEVMKKLAVYALEQAPCYNPSHFLRLFRLVALGPELLWRILCRGCQ